MGRKLSSIPLFSATLFGMVVRVNAFEGTHHACEKRSRFFFVIVSAWMCFREVWESMLFVGEEEEEEKRSRRGDGEGIVSYDNAVLCAGGGGFFFG